MKKILVIAGILILIFLGGVLYVHHTKSFSPQSTVKFEGDGLKVQIVYCQPYKKGRIIFGPTSQALAPYGKVWRTGANEATLFETNQDLKISGKKLKAGIYSLWTIPGEQTWTVIFNSEHGQWGIHYNGEANRDPKNDALTLEAQAQSTKDKVFEQFTITLEKVGEEMEMNLFWDKTLVAVPFSK